MEMFYFSREILHSVGASDISSEIWIGLTDQMTGEWAWLDGTAGDFSWGQSQPNGGDEHCARIVRSQNWLSFDFTCTSNFLALCEFSYRC